MIGQIEVEGHAQRHPALVRPILHRVAHVGDGGRAGDVIDPIAVRIVGCQRCQVADVGLGDAGVAEDAIGAVGRIGDVVLGGVRVVVAGDDDRDGGRLDCAHREGVAGVVAEGGRIVVEDFEVGAAGGGSGEADGVAGAEGAAASGGRRVARAVRLDDGVGAGAGVAGLDDVGRAGGCVEPGPVGVGLLVESVRLGCAVDGDGARGGAGIVRFVVVGVGNWVEYSIRNELMTGVRGHSGSAVSSARQRRSEPVVVKTWVTPGVTGNQSAPPLLVRENWTLPPFGWKPEVRVPALMELVAVSIVRDCALPLGK